MSQANQLVPTQSQQLIYSLLIGQGYPDLFSKLVTAQSGHETNGWTSPVYENNNNAFGYGYTGTSYKNYPDVESSVYDVSGYIDRKVSSGVFPDPSDITTADQWAQLLASVGYYTDYESVYSSGIARWFNDNLTVIATVATVSGGMIIFTLLIMYFLTFGNKHTSYH